MLVFIIGNCLVNIPAGLHVDDRFLVYPYGRLPGHRGGISDRMHAGTRYNAGNHWFHRLARLGLGVSV